jgi:hypothetical protein
MVSERFLAALLLLWNVQRSGFVSAAEEKLWLPGTSGSGPFDVTNAW